ncbi:MAG TPA: GTP-binding protein, partial [Burkholderiaceae bacterium]|nr:GTP-binding protein [Burkholderiaceae bacterium]
MKREDLPELQAEDRGVLRFLTCGSVDDGKSTLIGRLLYDTKALLADTLATLERTSARRGLSALDLSLATDGLVAEREQGITIDVAYRYFATARRKFIIADAPGHEQYTRNMVTAASTADVAVLLVDARKGILPQTKRHATIAALLGIRQLIVAVNKMDLVDYSQQRFDAICADFAAWLAQHAELAVDVRYLPLSALQGDNVVDPSARTPWYGGPTLVQLLEDAPAEQLDTEAPLRLPVQWVCRPAGSDFRGYAGRLESGTLTVGDEVI